MIMIKHLPVCISIAAMVMIAEASSLPELSLPFVDQPPLIDGVPDEPVWDTAAKADGFVNLKTRENIGNARMLMYRDRHWLYLAGYFSNAAMSHVDFMVTDRDMDAQRDESVEYYLDPGTEGKFYYHFVLSADNVQGEQRGRDKAWFIPWRSATRRYADHWTSEMAIPLTICAGYGALDKIRINILYNQIKIAMDDYGALLGRERMTYTWSSAISSPHEPDNFGRLLGLGDKPIETPFLAALDQVRVEPFNIREKRRNYAVSGMVRNYSCVSGAVKLVVEECSALTDNVSEITKDINLDGHGQVPFRMEVKVEDYTRRTARVRLEDSATGEILAWTDKLDMTALTLVTHIGVSRNYYTDEPEAVVECQLGLPADELANMRLKVFDEKERCIAACAAPAQRSFVSFAIANVTNGAHNYMLALEDQEGTYLFKEPFEYWKRAPRPGHEVKIDQFNQTLVKDGQAIFPVGIYMHGVTHWHEEIFQMVADKGFNLMVRAVKGHAMPESRADKYMELALKHNLMVSEWYGVEPKNNSSASMAEQEEICRADYERILPGVERELKIMSRYPNFLFHKNVDEPNLLNWNIRMIVAEYFYRTASELDYYHPVYTLFARQIPDVSSAFKVGDIYTYDIYTYPGWGGWANDPVKQMAKYTSELRAATRARHKAMIVAPLVTAVDPVRTPLPLSVSDQRAQTYAALIYGAKGLIYFCWSNIYAGEMWETLAALAKEISILAPSLLAPEPRQEIVYCPGHYDAAQLRFPMLHTRLFSHPDGGYVLLAVSCSENPVHVQYVIDDLPDSATVSRIFGDQKKYDVKTNRYDDEIDSYGTRAYRIDTGNLRGTVKLTVNMQADESRRRPRIMLRPEVAEIEKQKNHMPNPVFKKRRMYAQFPDFMRPVSAMLPNLGTPESGWFLDASNAWRGYPSLCMRWTEPFANIRHVAVPGNCWDLPTEEYGVLNSVSLAFSGVTLVAYPKIMPAPSEYVLSFYAKGGNNGDKISVYLSAFASSKNITLTDQWARYELAGLLKPPSNWWPGTTVLIRLFPGATVWINGLQMEQGKKATEFTER